jgi:hypothetical protein
MDKVCPQRWAHISLSVQDSCRTSALQVVMVRDGREQAIGDEASSGTSGGVLII